MSRGKQKYKGPKQKKPTGMVPTVTGKPIDLKATLDEIKNIGEKRSRSAELKGQMSNDKLVAQFEALKANQVVTQTLLKKKGIFTVEEFQEEWNGYVHNVVGVVKDGRINGTVEIDMFNIGKPPVNTTIDNEVGTPTIFIE